MGLIAPEDGPLSETVELRDSLVPVTISGGQDMRLKIFGRCSLTEDGSALKFLQAAHPSGLLYVPLDFDFFIASNRLEPEWR